ncbi:hypothetical protein DAEQUDRAFT_731388 [Daedalea quercina L-15889]|uniref:Uncharacterized protein n=1 Tax=Daedalea quercina L-15889 TaxID=1314783 RepID=A0A165MB80_9APHY|nr:hypothetical protein DAEQUDRAFT_731388 [Daedalea quercina L-15889]
MCSTTSGRSCTDLGCYKTVNLCAALLVTAPLRKSQFLAPTRRSSPNTPQLSMRSQNRLYVHPDLKADEEDVTLVTTVCLVLSLAVVGAIFILTLSCLLWDDCQSYPGTKYLSVRQLLSP